MLRPRRKRRLSRMVAVRHATAPPGQEEVPPKVMMFVRRAASGMKKYAARFADWVRWWGAVQVTDPMNVRRVTQVDPGWAPPVKLRVADVATMRHLSFPRHPSLHTRDLRVRLEHWEPPISRWRGRPLPIRQLKDLRLTYEPSSGRASAHVRLHEPVAVADVITALLPAFAPANDVQGAGFPRLAIDPTAPDEVLAVIPTRTARRVVPFPATLHGVGLQNAEILVVGADADEADRSSTFQLPFAAAGGFTFTTPRIEPARVDLQVHNPIGRLQSFQPSPPATELLLTEDGSGEIREIGAGNDGQRGVSFSLRHPLPHAVVRMLRAIESVSLARVGGSEEPNLPARLAELAATGVILHSLPADYEMTQPAVHEALVARMRESYVQTLGLERERRSVGLRREAMLHHGGFLEFAHAVSQRTGHRVLPFVSVILSSMRPDRIPTVLRMMAQQTYPHFEVVVVLHGVEAPSLQDVSDDLRNLRYHVIHEESTTLFGAALAAGVRYSQGDLITKLDDDDWYSEHHIWDLVLAHLYSHADLVGKTTEYLYFEGIDHTVHRRFSVEQYHEQAAGGAMLFSRATLDSIGGWRPTPNSTDRSVLIAIAEAGGISYRTHGLGYMYIRHMDSHTWQRTESQLLNGSFEQWRGMRLPETAPSSS
ncbi:glycosyltransferase [Agromyces bauzanensis]